MRLAVFALLALVGCASGGELAGVTDDELVTRDAAVEATAPDAAHDAGPDVVRPPVDTSPGRCAWVWTNTTEIIHCYTLGACRENVRCEPVLPITEDSGCQFRKE